MAQLKWNDNLSVQVEEMDRQHQKLIDMINALNDAMSKGKGKEAIGETINGLLNYTKTHFAEEEKYLRQSKYPELNNQITMHQKFVDKVMVFKQELESGKIAISIAVITFLSDWLKNHIQIEDKKYGPYLNRQGVK